RDRRGGGREQPEPVEQLVTLELNRCLGERGYIGQLRHAVARGDGDGAQPTVLDQRQRGGETGKAHGDGTGRNVSDGRRRTAIGHVQHVGGGHAVPQRDGVVPGG